MKKIERKIHSFDAANKSVGRLASQIAIILRGKNKPEFDPSFDMGDIVNIKNIDKLAFTGKKLDQKNYYSYSGYLGGLKTKSMKNVFEKKPADVLKAAVRDMLPPVKFRNAMMKRLIIITNKS